MLIRMMSGDDHAAIMEIYNDAIINTTDVYDYEPLSEAVAKSWFDDKALNKRPVLVAVVDGKTVGFATYGTFRVKKANQFSVEHSLYLRQEYRGRGIGKKLLLQLMDYASKDQVHAMFGCIDSENKISIELHKKLGFNQVGYLRECGYKFDRWLDLVIVEYIFN